MILSKILIVDDLPANLRALSRILAPLENIEVVEASSGKAALELLLHNRFAVILLDVNMPEMSGYEVAELISSSPQHSSTPIVMVTAQGADPKSVLRAYESGAVDYLAKPLVPLVVLNKVKQFVVLHISQERTAVLKAEREAILDAAGEGVIKISPDGVIEYCNAQSAKLLNMNQALLVGTDFNHWFFSSEHDFNLLTDVTADGVRDVQRPKHDLYSKLYSNVSTSGIVQMRKISVVTELNRAIPVEVTCTVTETPQPSLILLFHDISQQLAIQQRLERLANYDSLTGLANRSQFYAALEASVAESKKHGHLIALLLLDLDRFKEINDTLGHDVGDEVLKKAATRLVGSIGRADVASRLGGDEFAVLLTHLPSGANDAISVAERILLDIPKPIQCGSHQLMVETSIGIACCYAGEVDVTTLMKSADIALYAAKSAGRHTYQLFVPEMAASTEDRASIEAQLKKAIRRDELTVEYQPVVSIREKKIVGFEALVRWPATEEHERITPDVFIPIAEQSHLIKDITEFVVDQVCAQIAMWDKKFPDCRDFVVSINLSAQHLRESLFVVYLYHTLRRYSISSRRISLEITETAVLKNTQQAIFTLKLLRALGFSLSLDDFGTGYSSLSHLQMLPVDTIKIDRSFVSKVNVSSKSLTLIRAIMLIAEDFNIDVIAEGVESEGEIDTMSQVGCNCYQGFFFEQSLPPHLIEERFLTKFDAPFPDQFAGLAQASSLLSCSPQAPSEE